MMMRNCLNIGRNIGMMNNEEYWKVGISIIMGINIETGESPWEVPTEAAKAVDGNDKEEESGENKDQDQEKNQKETRRERKVWSR